MYIIIYDNINKTIPKRIFFSEQAIVERRGKLFFRQLPKT